MELQTPCRSRVDLVPCRHSDPRTCTLVAEKTTIVFSLMSGEYCLPGLQAAENPITMMDFDGEIKAECRRRK